MSGDMSGDLDAILIDGGSAGGQRAGGAGTEAP
jgi:hypothetical protein